LVLFPQPPFNIVHVVHLLVKVAPAAAAVEVSDYLAICSQQETDKKNILKDPKMLKRLNEIEKMEETDKGHILSVIDGFIKSIKIKNIATL
jgi:hypothetical protein